MLQAAAFEQQGRHDLEGITISRVLSSVAVQGAQLDALQLDGAQAVRLLLHAAWKAQQLEGALLEVQSGVALFPSTIPYLLQALSSPCRKQLAALLCQRTTDRSEGQQHQDAAGDVAGHYDAWLEQALSTVLLQEHTQQLQLQQDIGHLSVCDVLLLLGVWSDEQWEEGAGLILLQGVQDTSNLSQLSQLFRSLGDLTDGAGAQWLLGVGLAWATTCFLDCPVPSSSFEEAGLQLLKAGLIATVDLAEHGLAMLLQRLTSEASSKSCLWQVLHFVVNHCMDSGQWQQVGQGQLWQHMACPHHGLQSSCSQEHAPQVVQVLTNGLLAGLNAALQQQQPADMAVAYVAAVSCLAGTSCAAAEAFLKAAAALQAGQHQQQRQGAGGLDPTHVEVKLEHYCAAWDDGVLRGTTAPCGSGGAAERGAAATAAASMQQMGSSKQRRLRYNWGALACTVSSQSQVLVNQPEEAANGIPCAAATARSSAGATAPAAAGSMWLQQPLLSPAVAVAAAGCEEAASPLDTTGLTPFSSWVVTRSTAAGTAHCAASTATQPLENPGIASVCSASEQLPGTAGSQQVRQDSVEVQLLPALWYDVQARTKQLQRLLSAASQQQQQLAGASLVAADSMSIQQQQIVAALLSAVLRNAQPCSQHTISVVAGLVAVMQQLPAAGLQSLAAESEQLLLLLQQSLSEDSTNGCTGACNRCTGWPMFSCWRQAVLQLVELQLSHCKSGTSSCSLPPGSAHLHGSLHGLPSLVAALLHCWQLPIVPVNHQPLKLDQHWQQQGTAQHPLSPPQLTMLLQLLQHCTTGLLVIDAPVTAAGREMEARLQQCCAAVNCHVSRHQMLTVLLSWLLQHPHAAAQLEPLCGDQAQHIIGNWKQYTGDEKAAAAMSPAVVVLLAVLLQQLQAVGLAAALEQLACAKQTAVAAVADIRQQDPAGHDSAGAGAAAEGRGPAMSDSRGQQDPTRRFFVEHQAAGAAALGEAHTAVDASRRQESCCQQPPAGGGSNVSTSVMIPARLLGLSPAACQALLASVCNKLQGLADLFDGTMQWPGEQHDGTLPGHHGETPGSSCQRRHTRTPCGGRAAGHGPLLPGAAAAAAAGQGQGDSGHELPAASAAAAAMEAAMEAADQVALARIVLSEALPGAEHNLTSTSAVSGMTQQPIQLAAGASKAIKQLQLCLVLADLAVSSLLLAVDECSAAATKAGPGWQCNSLLLDREAGMACMVHLIQMCRLLSSPVLSAAVSSCRQIPQPRHAAAAAALLHEHLLPPQQQLDGTPCDGWPFSLQLQGLQTAALSAAALLLKTWWLGATAMSSNSKCPEAEGVETNKEQHQDSQSSSTSCTANSNQLQELQPFFAELNSMLAALQHKADAAPSAASRCGRSASSGTASGVSYRDWLAVFGDIGAFNWRAVKKLEQQHELLGVLLALAVQVHASVASSPSGAVRPAEPAVADCRTASSSMVTRGLLEHLAALRRIAADVFEAAGLLHAADAATAGRMAALDAAGGCRGRVSPAQRLLRQVDRWLLELTLGDVLSPVQAESPTTAAALLNLITTCKDDRGGSGAGSCSWFSDWSFGYRNLALTAHQLALHHSPRVYAAGQKLLWGRRGLGMGIGSSAAAAWLVGCHHDVAVDAAAQAVQLLLQGGICPPEGHKQWHCAAAATNTAANSSARAAGAAPASRVPAAEAAEIEAVPCAKQQMFWRVQGMCVAAACSCCELLLHDLLLQARQSMATTADAAGAGRLVLHVVDVDHLLLVVNTIKACLAGPCTSAANQLQSWLALQQEQQQDPSAAAECASSSTIAALHHQAAGARKGKKGCNGTGLRPMAPVYQEQLCLLVGLGCAAAQLAASAFSRAEAAASGAAGRLLGNSSNTVSRSKRLLLQRLQQLPAGRASVQELLLQLRQFSAASQGLMHSVETGAAARVLAGATGAAAAGDVGEATQVSCAAAVADSNDHPAVSAACVLREAASALAADLEQCMVATAAQRRRDAMAAAAAAAAATTWDNHTSSSSDWDAEPAVQDDAGANGDDASPGGAHLTPWPQPVSPGRQVAAGRFHDPDVHEELPGGVVLSDDELHGDDDDEDGHDNMEGWPAADQTGGLADVASQRTGQRPGQAHQPQMHAQRSKQKVTAANVATVAPLRSHSLSRTRLNQHGTQGAESGRRITVQDPTQATAEQDSTLMELHQGTSNHEHTNMVLKQGTRQLGQQQQQQCQQAGVCGTPRRPSTAVAAVAAARAAAATRSLPRQHPGLDEAVATRTATATAAAAGGCRAARCSRQQQQQQHSPMSQTRMLLEHEQQGQRCKRQSEQVSSEERDHQQAQQRQQQQLQEHQQQHTLLPVVCGSTNGLFDVEALLVTLPDGDVITPTAFERLAGRDKTKKWRKSIHVVLPDGTTGSSLNCWFKHNPQQGQQQQQQLTLQPTQDLDEQQQQQHTPEGSILLASGRAAALAASNDTVRKQQTSTGTIQPPQTLQAHAKGLRRLLAESVSGQPAPQLQAAEAAGSSGTAQHSAAEKPPVDGCWDVGAAATPSRKRRKHQQRGQEQRKQPQLQPQPQQGRRPRNAFVQACLAEEQQRRSAAAAAGSSGDDRQGHSLELEWSEGDDSDYSDLEDFIVCEQGTNYEKLCAEVGRRVTWRRGWQNTTGTAAGAGGAATQLGKGASGFASLQ